MSKTPKRHLVVLGAGTAGTMAVNKLRPLLPADEWDITIVDQSEEHHYQPGYLFVPFGTYRPDEIVKPRAGLIGTGIRQVTAEIQEVVTDDKLVRLADGQQLRYDQLIIATGTHPSPDETPGLGEPNARQRGVHSFYTLDDAVALRDALEHFDGGRLVVNLVDLPIKCPVAPLEFAFLAEAWLRERGLRERTEVTYVTPLDGAFTKPLAARELGGMFDERGIELEADFMLERVDLDDRLLVSYDEREVPFDLLVTVPLNMGAAFVGRSGLGDELNHVKVDKHTFLATDHDDIFALGDAANLPTSKAGSVAHFAVDVFVDNFLRHIDGLQMQERFDGHANCFIESGDGKAMLLDFNYDTEPLLGEFPLPQVGPLKLLAESEVNHWGKLAFRWIYWHVLLPGRPLPLSTAMSMLGKRRPAATPAPADDVGDTSADNAAVAAAGRDLQEVSL
ncbi:MAG: FAD/NAD(P)-binding oxidoreductase [Nitriliruptoraceae bacterium]